MLNTCSRHAAIRTSPCTSLHGGTVVGTVVVPKEIGSDSTVVVTGGCHNCEEGEPFEYIYHILL